MTKATTNKLFILPLLFVILILGLTSSTQNSEERVNFQDYCWPILGESDTVLIYQYQMSSVEYDTIWNRYFEIEAHNEGESRYFNYTVYNHNFKPQSHYKYAIDHKGIRLIAMEILDKDKKLMPGTIQHQRIFEWDLDKGDKHTSMMSFFNLQGDSTDLTISSSTQYEGMSKKIDFENRKIPAIRFFRKVTRHSSDFSTVSEGVSYYAKGIGYYRSHIVFNGTMEFDEILTDIFTADQWNKLKKEAQNNTPAEREKPEE